MRTHRAPALDRPGRLSITISEITTRHARTNSNCKRIVGAADYPPLRKPQPCPHSPVRNARSRHLNRLICHPEAETEGSPGSPDHWIKKPSRPMTRPLSPTPRAPTRALVHATWAFARPTLSGEKRAGWWRVRGVYRSQPATRRTNYPAGSPIQTSGSEITPASFIAAANSGSAIILAKLERSSV